jgi:hypothetical protein
MFCNSDPIILMYLLLAGLVALGRAQSCNDPNCAFCPIPDENFCKYCK